MLTIRKATPDDMVWVNTQYHQINFQLSDYNNELIAIAEVDGKRAGVGRLVTINENISELGGMYVQEDFRKYGIARSIVLFLISQVKDKLLYCLPFEQLSNFYQSCGFIPTNDQDQVPEKVLQKREWCNRTYPDKTLLLVQQV